MTYFHIKEVAEYIFKCFWVWFCKSALILLACVQVMFLSRENWWTRSAYKGLQDMSTYLTDHNIFFSSCISMTWEQSHIPHWNLSALLKEFESLGHIILSNKTCQGSYMQTSICVESSRTNYIFLVMLEMLHPPYFCSPQFMWAEQIVILFSMRASTNELEPGWFHW